MTQESHLLDSKTIIEKYRLQPHPEGGYFLQTYQSKETVPSGALPVRFGGDRFFSTAIYFLLEKGQFSAFHRIKSDEVWHFYYGTPLHIYVIHPDGRGEILKLGQNIREGYSFQHVVSAGAWFASGLAFDSGFSLVGCTVSPGFDFADFELASRESLKKEFPQHLTWINNFCRQP